MVIPVNIDKGDVIVPPIQLPNGDILPEITAKAEQGYCRIPVQREVNFSERIVVEPIDAVSIEHPPKEKHMLKCPKLLGHHT